jgi:hypothetical protein
LLLIGWHLLKLAALVGRSAKRTSRLLEEKTLMNTVGDLTEQMRSLDLRVDRLQGGGIGKLYCGRSPEDFLQ